MLDKTGTIQKILVEITRYDEASRLSRLKRHFRLFWDSTLSSWSCLEHPNDRGVRICAALAAQASIQLLFNFNHLWAPRIQWAFKENQLLPKKPVAIEEQLESALKQPDTSKLSELQNQTTELLQEEKHSWIDHPEELL